MSIKTQRRNYTHKCCFDKIYATDHDTVWIMIIVFKYFIISSYKRVEFYYFGGGVVHAALGINSKERGERACWQWHIINTLLWFSLSVLDLFFLGPFPIVFLAPSRHRIAETIFHYSAGVSPPDTPLALISWRKVVNMYSILL